MRIIVISTAIAFCLLLVGCGQSEHKAESDPQSTPGSTPTDSLTIELAGRDSMSVFQLLAQRHFVDAKFTNQGVFVQGIDSVFSNSEFFWVYSVNDTMAQVAADKNPTRTGDRVVWHFRRIGQ